MASLILLTIVALTSLAAYIAERSLGLHPAELLEASMEAFECIGLTMVFFLSNLAVGTTLILALRALTHHFISVYWMNDASLAVLSLLQALIFRRWREQSK